MTLTLRYAARSDRGLIRQNNQDSVYAGARLLAVADGMGGMAGGEVASNIVVAALAPLDDDAPGSDLIEALRRSIQTANGRLRDAVDDNPALEGMGTTLTAVLFAGSRIGLAHVGDSRAYMMRDGEMSQITKDDTYVQMLVDEGRISADEATTHPQRSLLTRALDGREVDPEFSIREVRRGDRYLICSDGLSGPVSWDTLADTLALPDPEEAADRLVQLALRGGGHDNITCIVADVVDVPVISDSPVVGGAAARDRGARTMATADSAAGRAALAAGPPDEAETEAEPVEEPRDRRPARTALIAVVLLLAVAGLGYAGWSFAASQYYVGTAEDRVAIHRGLEGSVGGLPLSRVDAETDIPLTDLKPVALQEVEQGIPAPSRERAEEIVDNLRNRERKPECTPAARPSPSPSASTSPSASPALSPSGPVPPRSPAPGTSVTPTPGTGPAVAPTGPAAPTASGSASPAPSPSAPADVPAPLGPQPPDCRTSR